MSNLLLATGFRSVKIYWLTTVEIESNVKVGPFSRIRPDAVLSKGSRVGNFVEIKNSRIGVETKINHLS